MSHRPVSRRPAICRVRPAFALLAALVGLVAGACTERDRITDPGLLPPDPGALPTSPVITAENARQGTTAWLVPESGRARSEDLAVWASPYSLAQQDTLDVFVNAARGPVDVHVYRLGWYAGLGGREVFARSGVAAARQPRCTHPFSAPVTCPWSRTLRIPSTTDWVSGIYLLKVVDAAGLAWMYPFVVRDGRSARFTAVVPQFTWQAYNDFGGSSLYSDVRRNPYVSFERPYASNAGASLVYAHGYSAERSVMRWLERSGYDVTYVSNVDLSLAGAFRRPVTGMLFIGHDEYWTTRQYDRVEAMRDAGTHLAFFSGNNAFWNVRLADGAVTGRPGHLVICYKTDASGEPDPMRSRPENNTVQFRNDAIGRPENGLYGVMYVRYVFGDHPLVAPAAPGPHAATFLAAAGIAPGDTLRIGIGNAEGDQIVHNGHTPKGIEVVLSMEYAAHRIFDTQAGWLPVPAGAFHTTFFVAPGGAGVFASGSNEWGRFLDDLLAPGDVRIQRLTGAVLDWMLAR